jgi:uncharacterized protein (DUF2237 family)
MKGGRAIEISELSTLIKIEVIADELVAVVELPPVGSYNRTCLHTFPVDLRVSVICVAPEG